MIQGECLINTLYFHLFTKIKLGHQTKDFFLEIGISKLFFFSHILILLLDIVICFPWLYFQIILQIRVNLEPDNIVSIQLGTNIGNQPVIFCHLQGNRNTQCLGTLGLKLSDANEPHCLPIDH